MEGSTAHLRSLGDRYGAALARHHAILRRAITAEGGREVGSEGDSLAAVLPSPTAAIRAAVAAQRELTAEPWPDAPWLVRMAVHAGRVDTTSAVAAGISLHEAARIRNLAHGGQVVVSDQARAAITDATPAEIGLIDLGTHAIRDFADEVRLHQVTAPGLAASFPPLRTIGIRSLRAAVLGATGPADTADTAELGCRDLLLTVLDDCEHLIAAVTDIVAALSGGDVTILAASREALRVTGEAV